MMVIKKKLKKWYPTKQQEDNALLLDKLFDAANQIHTRTLTNNAANWVIVGSEMANALGDLYPSMTTQQAISYTNRWCGTTFTTLSASTFVSI